MPKYFGTPDGMFVGRIFVDRNALAADGWHPPLQGGIHGNAHEGADSIVLSGGYKDDEDFGDYIIYTGHGGKPDSMKNLTEDQSISAPGNAGLITSLERGLPVRVTRGRPRRLSEALNNPYLPSRGLVYAGLFMVTDWWTRVGSDGYLIVQYRLDRIEGQAELPGSFPPPQQDPAYATTQVVRRIRDTALSRRVKELYGHKCQVCGTAVPGAKGNLYSEGAHVKPLGKPHVGSDSLDNLLSLCPNHHAQLDLGGMVILDNMTVAETVSLAPLAGLVFLSGHELHPENVSYHRAHWRSAIGLSPDPYD